MDKWLGYYFRSSSILTDEYAKFSREMKKYLKTISINNIELISYNRMHFCFSAFFKNNKTGKLVYACCFDVRYFQDAWYTRLLIRTAKHDKDYTGGRNQFCTLPELSDAIQILTK